MPRRRPILPAPVAGRTVVALPRALVTLLLGVLVVLPTLLLPSLGLPASAAPTGEGADPLRLEITELTPSVPRADEQVQISGTITNQSKEVWTTINVHAFHAEVPILDSASLAAAADTDDDEFLGPRVVEPGTFQTIPSLEPGQSVAFTTFIPAGAFVGGDGVYWAGVHALGQTETQLRDANTDGRARTFLPVISGERERVEAALVLPLRAPVRHTPAGRIADPGQWAELLGPGGRLRNLLEAGRAAGDRPVTWLLDPAVPHAATKLAAGNPRASLAPLPGAEAPADEEAGIPEATDDTPAPTPTEPAETSETPEEGEPEANPAQAAAAAAAQGWLELFRAEMAEHPVLALPYGDVDASALQRNQPELLDMARAHSASVLALLGITATPVLAAPDGFLSPDVVAAAPAETVMLLSDQALQDPSGQVPSTGRLLGHTFATTSSGVAAGGPGPEPAAGPVAVRQRVVSEAALRLLAGDSSPLVIAPPPSWDPATGSAVLYSTFDDGLLRLKPLSELVGADVLTDPQQAGDGAAGSVDELAPESLVYGEAQVEAELPRASVRAAQQRLERAQLLSGVLARESGLVGHVVEVVLPSTSYFGRRQAGAWRKRNVRGTDWLQERLGAIRVDTPLRATLSSDHGILGVTLVNDLDVSVRVRIAASSQGGLMIEEQEPLTLAPRSRRLLRLSATATREGKDELTLRVTDADGTPLGATSTYPVRTSQVSGALWVIMAVGAALLFGTIGVRLLRGNRRTRREQAEAEAAEAEQGEAEQVEIVQAETEQAEAGARPAQGAT